MTNANELRIGNWVLWNGPDHIENAKISAIANEEVAFKCGDYGSINDIQPIPLTPEILEKIGLKRDEEGWILDFDNKLYDPLGRNGTGGLSQRDTTVFAYKHTNSILKVGVRYLHQLQNIYFSLTGKELTFKTLNMENKQTAVQWLLSKLPLGVKGAIIDLNK